VRILLAALALLSFALPARPAAPLPGGGEDTLRGDYLEARTCDVWVGACYANSETSEAGKQATLAWKFKEGKWKGVDMKGTAAVLLVDAKSTLGDRFHSPLPVRNVLLLDETASDAQLVALRDFVKAQAGELGGNVIEEKLVSIELKTDCCKKEGCAKLVAGDLVRIETRCLVDDDKVCGHENTYYPPLLELQDKHPAYTVEHTVKETLLLKSWSDPDARSSFIGKFELTSPPADKKVDESSVVSR